MKVSSLLHGFNRELEERKRTQQRKGVGEVYKKHAKYVDANKNPMLKALEDLLSGKTEKELHKADGATRKNSPQTLINENKTVLAPVDLIPQDLHVATTTTAQMQQVHAEKVSEQIEQNFSEEGAPFANEDLTFEMPEKFQKDFSRNPVEQTVFGQELEKQLFQRTFTNATQKYGVHIAMVTNGYRLVDEPTFSKTA